MNMVYLTGYLMEGIVLKKTQSGKTAGIFTLAVKKRRNTAGSGHDAVFVPIVVWESLADTCAKYLCKGSKALVSGELVIRSYGDAEGTKRWVTEVTAQSIEFMDKKQKDGGRALEKDYPEDMEPPDIDEEEVY